MARIPDTETTSAGRVSNRVALGNGRAAGYDESSGGIRIGRAIRDRPASLQVNSAERVRIRDAALHRAMGHAGDAMTAV